MNTVTPPSMLSRNEASARQGTVITRSVLVNITGSLANLAMQGTQAAVWRPVEGMQLKVFGLGADADAQVATNQLRTALIHEVLLLEHRSTFPVAMGANIECIPNHEKTDMGDGYAYTVLPQSVINTPHVLYQCDVGAEEGNQVGRAPLLARPPALTRFTAVAQGVPQVQLRQHRQRGHPRGHRLPLRFCPSGAPCDHAFAA